MTKFIKGVNWKSTLLKGSPEIGIRGSYLTRSSPPAVRAHPFGLSDETPLPFTDSVRRNSAIASSAQTSRSQRLM